MSGDGSEKEQGPVLPRKDLTRKPKQSSVYLPQSMWDQLDEIAEASGEYTRNEVIQIFLENRIRAWLSEQQTKKTSKK